VVVHFGGAKMSIFQRVAAGARIASSRRVGARETAPKLATRGSGTNFAAR